MDTCQLLLSFLQILSNIPRFALILDLLSTTEREKLALLFGALQDIALASHVLTSFDQENYTIALHILKKRMLT